jgi:pimeloyl-ACP methyl ester carboxylesterase
VNSPYSDGGRQDAALNKPTPHLRPDSHHHGTHGYAKSLFVTAHDGLRLHVREYGSRSSAGIPVVCLPGLARTAADFDELAPALAAGPPARHVIAVDSRGRGHSDHDADHANYNCMVELGDIVNVLIALGVGPAIFIGSSRGGVLIMMMAAMHPMAIAGAVLHDVGPVTEAKGFARIKGYLGKLPHPRTYEEGADILRRLLSAQFPKLTDEQWMGSSKRTWHLKHGTLKPAFDVGIANAISGIDVERPLASLWNEFDALGGVPMLAIRGQNSDILSAATMDAMRERRGGNMEAIEVPDQGHAPLLEGELVRQIVAFVARCQIAREAAPDKNSAA